MCMLLFVVVCCCVCVSLAVLLTLVFVGAVMFVSLFVVCVSCCF